MSDFRPRGTNESMQDYLVAKQQWEVSQTGSSGIVLAGQPGSIQNPNPSQQPTAPIQPYVPPAQSVPQPAIPSTLYGGPSIVDYLKSINQPSDYASRAQLAAQKGIQNYTGTAEQNTQLLNLLRQSAGGTESSVPVSTKPQNTGVWVNKRTGEKVYSNSSPGPEWTEETIQVPVKERDYGPKPGSQPSPGSPEQQIQQMQAQLADLQAQKDALTRYGLTDTTQLTKTAAGTYVPTNTPDEKTPVERTYEEIRDEVYKKYNIDTAQKDWISSPTQSFETLYKDIYDKLDLASVKTKLDDVMAQIDKASKDYAAAVGDINDNPWISEAGRVGKIEKLNINYENKTKGLQNTATMLQNAYDRGKEEATNTATRALEAYDQQRTYAKEELDFLVARALADIEAKTTEQTEAKKFRYETYPEYLQKLENIKKTSAETKATEEKGTGDEETSGTDTSDNSIKAWILANKQANPGIPYYDLWGALADEMVKQGLNPSNYDKIFWEILHPEGLAGYNKYVLGK